MNKQQHKTLKLGSATKAIPVATQETADQVIEAADQWPAIDAPDSLPVTAFMQDFAAVAMGGNKPFLFATNQDGIPYFWNWIDKCWSRLDLINN